MQGSPLQCIGQQINRLACQHRALQQEVLTLRHCLADSGVLCPTNFLTKLHRLKFNQVKQTSQWSSNVRLENVCAPSELASFVSEHGGTEALHALRCTSKAIQQATTNVAIYLCGGTGDGGAMLKSTLRFDPSNGVWTELQPMHIRRAGHAAAILARQLYVSGGSSQYSCTLERYTPWTNKWEAMRSMHKGRVCHAAAAVSNRLCVCGGEEGMGVRIACTSAEMFDPTAGKHGTWEALPPMLEPRCLHVAVTFCGRMFALGGKAYFSLNLPLSSVESLNFSSRTWVQSVPLPAPQYALAATVMHGYLYVCGGEANHKVLATAARFNPAKNVWERLPHMPEPRKDHIVAAVSGQLYVVGGASMSNDPSSVSYPDAYRLDSAYRFDAGTFKWRSCKSLPARRSVAAGSSIAV